MLTTGGKKKKRDNLDTHEKELLKNYEKKGKRKLRDNLDDKREQIRYNDKNRKKEQTCGN